MRRRLAPTREKGVEHGSVKARRTWLDRKSAEEAELGHKRQPYCLIVGGGQAGIGLGARLKRLGVPTLIIDKHERPGDQWRKRYKSLCLHDPVWYDHMPYLPFPEHWPVFSPKDKIGDWLEMYTKVMELNYWPSTECKSAPYDEKRKEWTVKVERGTKTITLKPKQLILATGMSGVPNRSELPRRPSLQGRAAPFEPTSGRGSLRGKKCVVIGSNNSAHDICADLCEHGADVTMVQRSSTHVARSDTLMELGLGGALFGGRREGRHHDREGGYDLRLDPLRAPGRFPGPRLQGDRQARREVLSNAREGGLHASIAATTTPVSS